MEKIEDPTLARGEWDIPEEELETEFEYNLSILDTEGDFRNA